MQTSVKWKSEEDKRYIDVYLFLFRKVLVFFTPSSGFGDAALDEEFVSTQFLASGFLVAFRVWRGTALKLFMLSIV